MTSTEIALLLNVDAEKITRIGEIIGKKIPEKDNFSKSYGPWLVISIYDPGDSY